ncbi:MAG: lytic transglycosylase domain-containing protein [Bacteroidetes bacterium]|nr:lytic transglycosylase domain-containing protein [Bacteroidota bacterium]MBP9795341.1 lytic transglycosylase domain-containing protein [Chitinophagales bacterium]
MKKIHYILIGAFSGIAIFIGYAVSGNSDIKNNKNAVVESSDTLRSLADDVNTIKYFAAKVPATISFAGEPVPLNDFEVLERMDRELTVTGYWHSSTIQNLKLAHRWFPIIEKVLKENNIPDDFKYLAMAESGLRNVVSPAEAHGYWQFLKGTAVNYGLTVTAEVDERYDMEKSTRAAAKYLKDAYAKFGNWTLAAASYNAGMGGIEGVVDYQNTDSYYDLYLKDETSRYIFRALAFKLVYENSQDYGFFLSKEDLYDPWEYKTVKVDTTILNLAEFAQQHNTTYKMVKYYNPWLRSNLLTVKKGEVFEIKLPLDAAVK